MDVKDISEKVPQKDKEVIENGLTKYREEIPALTLGREFYIIRAHEGEHTFMHDLDEEPDTITISTDMFSSYAIAYAAAGSGNGGNVCGLCHICPTFLGVCCFIWLAAVIVVILFTVAVISRREKEKKQKE